MSSVHSSFPSAPQQQSATLAPDRPEQAPDQAPRAALAVSPHSTSARLSWAAGRRGVRGPTDARLGEAQAPRRETRLDPATPETPRQQPPRPHLGSHIAFPPAAPSEAAAPGAPLRHRLHGPAGLTHAPRSSAGPPACPSSRPGHRHTTGSAPHVPPKVPGQAAAPSCRQRPGPDTRYALPCRAGPVRDPGSSSGPKIGQNKPRIKPRVLFSWFPPQHEW
jgi:hypothetical protein